MIFYYSSTGNSRHVAMQVGKQLNITPQDITQVQQTEFDLKNNDLIVVTYNCFWGVADYVKSFINKTTFLHVRNIFWIITCGGFLGGTDLQIEILCQQQQLPKPIIYSLKMVTNYSILHDIPPLNQQRQQLQIAEDNLELILKKRIKPYHSPWIIRILQPIVHQIYQKYQTTQPFSVSSACIACCQCVNNCPVSAIDMIDNKPVWTKKDCDHCLKCLHHCPVAAINYGKSTQNRLRYTYETTRNY